MQTFYTTRSVWYGRGPGFGLACLTCESRVAASRVAQRTGSHVQDSAQAALRIGTPSSVDQIIGFLISNPRVTVVGGVQDQAVVALSRGQLYSSGQVLPTISVRSQWHPIIGSVPHP